LADKPTQLVLDALSRAVGEAPGLPLFASKNGPGLFPGTPAARQAAQRCKDDHLLRVVGTDNRGKAAQEICAITDAGLTYLLEQAHPRTVLEDLVRAVEARQRQFADLVSTARQSQASLDALRAATEKVLHALPASPLVPSRNGTHSKEPDEEIALLRALAEWHAPEDCPLPELHRRAAPALTVGRFHDHLRRLHDRQQIDLHPWTGPIYDLPEPTFALLVGHAVMYYARRRVTSG
jgi:hypothetical protein